MIESIFRSRDINCGVIGPTATMVEHGPIIMVHSAMLNVAASAAAAGRGSYRFIYKILPLR